MKWYDVKYVNLISSRLSLFKQTKSNVWNFRCPYCGDSKKSKTKARGYLYEKKDTLLFTCKNCQHGTTFKIFLKDQDVLIYKEYVIEAYKNKNVTAPIKKTDVLSGFTKPISSILSCCSPLYRLPKDHMCVKYVKDRGISYRFFRDLYYIEDINILTSKLPEYKDNKFKKDAKLVIPYTNEKGKLTHIQLRTIEGHGIRYITLTLDDSAQKVYGLDRVDFGKEIRVVEGPLDSLFVFNSIASGGIDLLSLSEYSDDMVFIFDKQPRNESVVLQIEKAIAKGVKICLLPSNLKGKDINQFVLNGYNIETIIRENTFKGLKAKLAFSKWRKI